MRIRYLSVALGWTVVAVAAAGSDPKSLAVPPEKLALAKELVRKLDDDDVDVREKASADLKAMDRLALPALVEVMKGTPSNEVSLRVEKLLPGARKKDFDARAKVFLADNDRKFDHDLLGWSELKKAAGDTPEARMLFADILTDDECREVLLSAVSVIRTEQEKFEKRWEVKVKGWRKAGRELPHQKLKGDEPIHFLAAGWLGDLLAERDYRCDFRHHVMGVYLTTAEGELAKAGKGKYGRVFIKLARAWIEAQTQFYGLREADTVCREMKFEESLRLRCHERLVGLGLVGLMSLGELARTGDRKYLPTLTKFFDQDYVQNRDPTGEQKVPEIQTRDMALAFCVELTGQDVAEYGFSVQWDTKKQPAMKYISNNYFFRSDKEKTAEQKREAAFKKWAEWEKANPLPAVKDKK
ncbi:MAG: hypothetical protein ABGY75_07910 [Gemmataceae bacterium]